MADFCYQCTAKYFGDELAPKNDCRDLISKMEYDNGSGAVVLCEGCGPTMVDHEGRCLGCNKHPFIEGPTPTHIEEGMTCRHRLQV